MLQPETDIGATIKLKSVVSVQHTSLPENVLTGLKKEIYSIIIRTLPGHALFQAMMTYESYGPDLLGEISHLNRYGNQSHCTHKNYLRPYCYCKDLLNKNPPGILKKSNLDSGEMKKSNSNIGKLKKSNLNIGKLKKSHLGIGKHMKKKIT